MKRKRNLKKSKHKGWLISQPFLFYTNMEINNNRHNILSSTIAPNPQSVKYWADLTTDPNGGAIKVWDGKKWNAVTGGSDETLINSLITKVNELEVAVAAITKDMPTIKNSINDLSDRVSVLESI